MTLTREVRAGSAHTNLAEPRELLADGIQVGQHADRDGEPCGCGRPATYASSIEDGSGRSDAKGTIAGFKALGTSLLACVLGVSTTLAVNAPVAQAKNGDTHVTGQGISQTLDCYESTLFVMGTGNYVTAKGTCWGIAVQGSSNIVIADNVINDIVVYGYDQTVLFHDGAPSLLDRGRELGMTNRIDRVPA
jgi:hypothetical protein